MGQKTRVQFQVKSYQQLKKWYLMPLFLFYFEFLPFSQFFFLFVLFINSFLYFFKFLLLYIFLLFFSPFSWNKMNITTKMMTNIWDEHRHWTLFGTRTLVHHPLKVELMVHESLPKLTCLTSLKTKFWIGSILPFFIYIPDLRDNSVKFYIKYNMYPYCMSSCNRLFPWHNRNK